MKNRSFKTTTDSQMEDYEEIGSESIINTLDLYEQRWTFLFEVFIWSIIVIDVWMQYKIFRSLPSPKLWSFKRQKKLV